LGIPPRFQPARKLLLEVGRTPEIMQGITTLAAAVTVSFSAY
jgi:hypothetical protein